MDAITITVNKVGDEIVIAATVNDGAVTLPPAIFTYVNSGTTTLGDYFGVCNANELGRFQEFTGTAIPVFGNAFVRARQAKISLPLTATKEVIDRATLNIRMNCSILKSELAPRLGTSTIYSV
jgi:hypothetical protein